MTVGAAVDDEAVTPRRTWLAAERTFLAWWRTGLAASVAGLAVGRVLPEVTEGARWPYVVLGVGYAALAVGVFALGERRRREIDADLHGRQFRPLASAPATSLTVAGALVALTALVLVLAD